MARDLAAGLAVYGIHDASQVPTRPLRYFRSSQKYDEEKTKSHLDQLIRRVPNLERLLRQSVLNSERLVKRTYVALHDGRSETLSREAQEACAGAISIAGSALLGERFQQGALVLDLAREDEPVCGYSCTIGGNSWRRGEGLFYISRCKQEAPDACSFGCVS